MYGIGHDIVDVVAFAEQLAEPGTRMRELFSMREIRQANACAQQKNDGEAVHLAAKWAGKEAFLKAWCEALGERPYPFTLDNFPWHEIEILDDSHGVPHVMLSGRAKRAFRDSLGSGDSSAENIGSSVVQSDYAGSILVIHISLSHDGPIASAVVMLSD
ncbi:4'-phosphopantetheinyl transferase [Bifidobacterium saguini DSM 23967]|uniref:Holo-[acyl-carrier-protein] synthase n=2 Tax=Bifidobacterium saguini TaxID=762210 RepID=A0A087D8I8_9BIFI|nr:4'-phosphopantetheinyl transferase [Bifidobacterium saguini DSM 23967]